MRIRVTGTTDSAKALRGLLIDGGYLLDEEVFNYTINVIDTDSDIPVIDSIDCRLESAILGGVALVANTAVLVDRPGQNRSDTLITIGIPLSFSTERRSKVERGIRGGIENMMKAMESARTPDPVSSQQPQVDMALNFKMSEVLSVLKEILNAINTKPEEPRSWWQRLFS